VGILILEGMGVCRVEGAALAGETAVEAVVVLEAPVRYEGFVKIVMRHKADVSAWHEYEAKCNILCGCAHGTRSMGESGCLNML
jgi:hypothetical protein